MKTSKRLAASLIAVAILCGVFFTSLGAAPVADAAEDSSTSFTDVPEGAWYAAVS